MPENNKGTETSKQEEARSLAQEAVEEMRHGDKEEGKFLAEEAKQLDPGAASEVLGENGGKSKGAKR